LFLFFCFIFVTITEISAASGGTDGGGCWGGNGGCGDEGGDSRAGDEDSSGGSGGYCFGGNDGGEVIRINIGIGRLVRVRTWKEIKRAMQGSTCLAIIVRNVRKFCDRIYKVGQEANLHCGIKIVFGNQVSVFGQTRILSAV